MERTIASSKAGTAAGETAVIETRPILTTFLSYLAIVWRKTHAAFWNVRDNLSSDFAKPLDTNRISTQLAVVKRAQEEGHRNLPPTGEEVPSGTQREIIAFFTNLRRRARQQVAENAEKSSALLEQIQIPDSLAKLRDIPAECENKIRRQFADVEAHLSKALELEQKQKQHYDAFRKQNGLDRVATYPRAVYPYYLLVPVLVAAIAFALANLNEVQTVANVGPSVGWILAVAALVVVVPFVLGDRSLRDVNHVGDARRFFGRIGVTVAIVIILGAAFYTDFHIAYVLANPNEANRDVLNAILAAPADVVSTVANWKGFGLVVLTGLFAMLLAYRSDDPYPDYGGVQRSFYKARDAREDAFSRLRKHTNNLIDQAGADVASLSRGVTSKVRMYQKMVDKSKQYPSALNDYDIELEDACNVVLDTYRMSNAVARQSDPPLSFAEHICFNPMGDMELPGGAQGGSHVAELQTAISELENAVDLAQKELRTLNVRMLDSISESNSLIVDIE